MSSMLTSPPRAVSCCLRVSSSCSLTSSCWLFLSRSVSREIIRWKHYMPSRNFKTSKAHVAYFWTGNSKNPPKKQPSIRQRGQALVHLQQLAFVGAGRSDMTFGHFINLSPEVSILLLESLQLCLCFWDRAAGFETQPGDEVLFSTFRGHGFFTGVTQNSTEKRTIHRGNLSTMWMDTENRNDSIYIK